MNKNKAPGWFTLIFGCLYPFTVIVIEFATRMCAEVFFDPIPSIWHVILVILVPLSNLLLWWQLNKDDFRFVKSSSFVAALASTIAAVYTLLFIPLVPLAFIAIVFYGMGLLPLAPLASMIVAMLLYRQYHARIAEKNLTGIVPWKGVVVALAFLIVLDIRPTITHFAVNLAASSSPAQSTTGVRILRTFADEDILLQRCYDRSGRPAGPLSFSITLLDGNAVSTAVVREIYYRVVGEPFNTKPPPYSRGNWAGAREFEFDRDLGGAVVGGRIKDLYLASSRLDASLSGADGIAYMEWVLEFRNDSPIQREVRMEIELPTEGVVSRATLWVHGEEREAAFAGKTKVREAYERIVQARRDPLLVTTRGDNRIQAQAFPLPPNGGAIKFRLGITAPMTLLNLEQRQVLLPSIVDRNFNIDHTLKHQVWVESQHATRSNLPLTTSTKIDEGIHRLAMEIDDATLAHPRKYLHVDVDKNAGVRWSKIGDDGARIVQTIIETAMLRNEALLIVVDGSEKVAKFRDRIISALNTIPDDIDVGLLITAEDPVEIAIGKWDTSQQQAIKQAIASAEFIGGQDNAPALAKGLQLLEDYATSELLWIHASQPVEFNGSVTRLEQVSERLARLPRLVHYPLVPGPNRLLAKSGDDLATDSIPYIHGPERDLGGYLTKHFTKQSRYRYQREKVEDVKGMITGSEHIARLWARDQVNSLTQQTPQNRDKAIALAAHYQLVTKVSGAVVLETQSQYESSGLQPVEPHTVPTIPEPEQWILAFIVMIVMLWAMRPYLFKRNPVWPRT